jgi:hypothetical protein
MIQMVHGNEIETSIPLPETPILDEGRHKRGFQWHIQALQLLTPI